MQTCAGVVDSVGLLAHAAMDDLLAFTLTGLHLCFCCGVVVVWCGVVQCLHCDAVRCSVLQLASAGACRYG